MIKKIFFFSAIIFCAAALAQNFTFIPDHTALTGNPGEEVVFDIPITNTSTQTITLFICRKVDELPANWYSSMCFDQSCFPSFLDSLATTPDFNSSPLAPGETRDFSMHVLIDSFNTGTGHIKLLAGDTRNLSDTISVDLFATFDATVVDKNNNLDFSFALNQNYPNPFNPSTIISWQLPERANVTLNVYDLLGNKVAELVNELQDAGRHNVEFSSAGKIGLVSGIYLYQIKAGSFTQTKKLMLLK